MHKHKQANTEIDTQYTYTVFTHLYMYKLNLLDILFSTMKNGETPITVTSQALLWRQYDVIFAMGYPFSQTLYWGNPLPPPNDVIIKFTFFFSSTHFCKHIQTSNYTQIYTSKHTYTHTHTHTQNTHIYTHKHTHIQINKKHTNKHAYVHKSYTDFCLQMV